jgi:choline-sulfatase
MLWKKMIKRENTYIVFTADHGLGCGHHGLLGKQNMYDHSIRVPYVVVGPEVEAGKRDLCSDLHSGLGSDCA